MSPALAGLRSRLASPSLVLIGTTALLNVLRIGNTMLLTRLLAPRDFGLIGIILSTLYIVSLISDLGYQAFVVRHERGDERGFLDVIWSIHVIRGFALCGSVMLIAEPLALFTGKPDLTLLMIGVAPMFILDGFISSSLLTTVRHGNIRKLSLIDLGQTVTQMIAGLIAGVILHNAWAVVIAMQAGSVMKTAASYLLFPDSRRRFALDRTLAAELWRFSRVIAASSMITLVISQVDKLILARLFSLPEFGVYTIAANLAAAPVALAMTYVARIVYPAVAKGWRESPETIGRTIYAQRGRVFRLFLFCSGGLIGSASLLVRVIYDPRYAGAAPFLRILAITSALIMLTRSISESLVAIGRIRVTLDMNVIRLGWLILVGPPALYLYGPFGLVVTLGLIEVPAYVYGLGALRRERVLDMSQEVLSLGLVTGGVAAGYGASIIAGAVLSAYGH